MSAPSKISQATIQRAIRAALAEGLPIWGVEVLPAQGIVRVLAQPPTDGAAEEAERRMREAFGK